jgi:hypothetical protein
VNPPPTSPRQLFHLLDSGRITPAEFRQQMRLCAEEILVEMEEDHLNPISALLEQTLSRRAAKKLLKKHAETLIREVLQALSELEDFPPARWLWNAAHPHMPLHAFFRSQRKPTFLIREIDAVPQLVSVTVEYGITDPEQRVREIIRLRRDRRQRLGLERRQVVPD